MGQLRYHHISVHHWFLYLLRNILPLQKFFGLSASARGISHFKIATFSRLRGSYQCLNILKYLTYNQFSLNLPIVVVQQEFADSSTILHPVDSLEPFAT